MRIKILTQSRQSALGPLGNRRRRLPPPPPPSRPRSLAEAELPRRLPGPSPKGAAEMAGVLEAKMSAHRSDTRAASDQTATGDLPPNLVEFLTESGPRTAKAALESARADAQNLSSLAEARVSAPHEILDRPLTARRSTTGLPIRQSLLGRQNKRIHVSEILPRRERPFCPGYATAVSARATTVSPNNADGRRGTDTTVRGEWLDAWQKAGLRLTKINEPPLITGQSSRCD